MTALLEKHPGLERVAFFALAVGLYMLVATLAEREFAMSTLQLANAAYGCLFAALIVFVALPRLLYKRRDFSFAIFCLGGVIVFAVLGEVVLDPLVMTPDDPRRAVSLNGLRFGALNATFTAFSITAMVMMFDSLESRKNLSVLRELRHEAELTTLKSQLNPHLILNTLNNLYSLALERDERTPEMVLMLSEILRYSLYESEDVSAPLEREIEILQAYIALQEIGVGERVRIRFDIEGSPAGRDIVPLLIVPIVENAFKHGSAVVRDEPTELEFTLCIMPESIRFVTTNPFIEQQDGNATPGGIGLSNLRGRLQVLYPNRHTLDVKSDEGLFRVDLTVTGAPE